MNPSQNSSIRRKMRKMLETKTNESALRITAETFQTTIEYVKKVMELNTRISVPKIKLDKVNLDDFSKFHKKSIINFKQQTWLSPVTE